MKIKKYGKSDEEVDVEEAVRCREIVQEILNFGVNQFQIKKIIQFLSLELEDRDLLIALNDVIKNDLEDNKTSIIH